MVVHDFDRSDRRIVTGKLFFPQDYARALALKEETGAIMIRRHHPFLGLVYEVRFIPQPEVKDEGTHND
jgi:hypothetical protein